MKTMKKNTVASWAPSILAVALAVFGCGPGPGGDDDDDSDTGTGEGPACTWEKIYDGEVKWIEGFSADEIYALAEDSIIKWDGNTWTDVAAREQGVDLGKMFIDSQRSFYFSSYKYLDGCRVKKYSDSQWSCIWSPDEEINLVSKAWGTGGANDIWVVGVPGGGQENIFHMGTNGSWTSTWSGIGTVESIWGRGADDIYAIGMGFGQSHAMHYDGTGWKALPPLPGIYGGNTSVSLLDIAADASGALWAVGSYGSEYDSQYPVLARFDGTTWEIVIDQDDVPEDPDDEGLYTGNLTGIHFFADGKAVAVGRHLLYLYDGSSWTNVERVLQNGESHVLKYYSGLAVWGVSAQDFHVAVSASGIYRVSCDW